MPTKNKTDKRVKVFTSTAFKNNKQPTTSNLFLTLQSSFTVKCAKTFQDMSSTWLESEPKNWHAKGGLKRRT